MSGSVGNGVALALLLAVLPALPIAAQADAYLSLETSLHSAYSTADDQWRQGELTLRPRWEQTLGANTDLVLSGRVRLNFDDALDGQQRDLGAYDPLSRPAFDQPLAASLRDAYIERSIGAGHLRLGKQQIVWGALDGLKLLDALNPQSFRSFILDDFDESRISQWSALLEWPLAGGQLELALIPDTSVHELPTAEAAFALTAERFRFGLDQPSWQQYITTGTAGVRLRRDRDRRLGGGTWGLRYSRFAAGWDLALSIQQGLDHQPVGQLSLAPGPAADTTAASTPPVLTLTQAHRQRRVIGFSASKSFGAVALRSEFAYKPGRAFNRMRPELPAGAVTALETVRRDQYGAAIGLDWQAPADLFVSVQLLHEQIRGHQRNFLTPAKDLLATAVVRRRFRHDSLTAELRWYGNLADGDGLLRPMLALQLGDSTEVALGGDFFYGAESGLFGQFRQADRLTLSLTRYF
jgi:hypothetical protein